MIANPSKYRARASLIALLLSATVVLSACTSDGTSDWEEQISSWFSGGSSEGSGGLPPATDPNDLSGIGYPTLAGDEPISAGEPNERFAEISGSLGDSVFGGEIQPLFGGNRRENRQRQSTPAKSTSQPSVPAPVVRAREENRVPKRSSPDAIGGRPDPYRDFDNQASDAEPAERNQSPTAPSGQQRTIVRNAPSTVGNATGGRNRQANRRRVASQTASAGNPRVTVPFGAASAASLSPAGQLIKAGEVYFGLGSARISGDDQEILDIIASTYKARGGQLQIVGHSSRRSARRSASSVERTNFALSVNRALAVKRALLRRGVSSRDVNIAADGDSSPQYAEDSEVGEAGNRRVEIYMQF